MPALIPATPGYQPPPPPHPTLKNPGSAPEPFEVPEELARL